MEGTDLVDFHTHSSASDGTLTPAELAEEAARRGVKMIALSDHDTLDGVKEFCAACDRLGVSGIAGVEVSCEFQGTRLHLVGLGMSTDRCQALAGLLETARRWRDERNREMIVRLNRAGIAITMDEVEQEAGGEVIARPHFARVLQRRGMVPEMPEAFVRYLVPGTPGYVAKKKPSLSDAVGAIHASGGLAIVAHPTSLLDSNGGKSVLPVLRVLGKSGVDGYEAWNPEVPLATAHKIVRLARTQGLLVSGGSDFHGDNRYGRSLARGAENCRIEAGDVAELVEKLAEMRNAECGMPSRGGSIARRG